jgi:DNA-binding transcriptional MerR regulator
MFKIGDFSKLTRVSIRMLRHYDEMGLLPPAHIDTDSGYRFYNAEQLPRLNRILALQDLGFSLRQIGELLAHPLSMEQLRGMLLQKQAELQEQVRAEQERLARVAARLDQIELAQAGGEGGRYDVVIKELPAVWVAGARATISSYSNIGFLFERVFAHLAPLRVQGLPAAIWHNDSAREDEIDAQALVFLEAAIPASALVQVYQLPAQKMATLVHHGSYLRLPQAYNALTYWLARGSYQISGANREVYLHFSTPARQDDDSYITEIQFPIQHATE